MNNREKILKIIVALTEAHIQHGITSVDVPHMARLSELTEGQIRPVLRDVFYHHKTETSENNFLYNYLFENSPNYCQKRWQYGVNRHHLVQCIRNLQNGRNMYHHVLEALFFTPLALEGLTGPIALREVA